MYLNAKTHPWKAAMFQVRDLDTGKIIPHVRWADEEAGTYCQYILNEDNEVIIEDDGEPKFEIKKGNVKLEEKPRE